MSRHPRCECGRPKPQWEEACDTCLKIEARRAKTKRVGYADRTINAQSVADACDRFLRSRGIAPGKP